MADLQTISTPQRGVVELGLTLKDLADIEGGITVRVPHGRYFTDVVLREPAVVAVVEDDQSDEAYN